MAKTVINKLISIGVLMFLFMPLTLSYGDTNDNSEPIKNLNFQSAEIRSVIRFLADYGHVNVVVAPAVEGKVTIALNNVTWKQAMEIIGRTYNLAVVYEREGYIRILPEEDLRKEVTEQNKYVQDQANLVPLETKIIKISNSTASAIVDAVKTLLSARGKVTADKLSNSIVLQEMAENIDRIVKFITELDRPPRQIRISAQLIEVSANSLLEIGVDWSVAGPTTDVVTSNVTSQSLNEGKMSDRAGDYQITAIPSGWDLSARISALVTSGKGKIIAHPEITTIENTEAKIQMGQKIPVKQYDGSGNLVIVFEEIGTMLRVTPHITSDNKILMALKPERSTYEYDANGLIINTNNAVTSVLVDNGQTAVIGGLTTQDEIQTRAGIPVLMDLPIIGDLFSYTKKKVENRDLVIFVTPTVVDAFATAAGETP